MRAAWVEAGCDTCNLHLDSSFCEECGAEGAAGREDPAEELFYCFTCWQACEGGGGQE